MKKNNIYLAVAAALLSLAACNKEIATTEAGDITIDATIGAMTRVSYDGASTSFTAGDQITVYAWMGDATAVPATRVVDGVRNTLGTDGKWTPSTQMRWKTVTDPHFFLGVYPAKDITDFTADAYTLNPATYTDSDLLIATNFGTGNAGLKASNGTVPLTFDHAMAKLNVNLKFRSQWDATPTVTSVTVKAKKTATVNYLTKAVTATGDASEVDIPKAASAATGYALSYSGLQVPQTGVTAVTVTIADKEYLYESTKEIPLVGGQYTTLGLIVGKDKLELGSISVTDWEAGTTLPDGDAELINCHNGHVYVDMGEVNINGVKKHLYWATCNVGADNPWDYGDYYAWGETTTKGSYTWDNYAFMQDGQSDYKHITKYTFADGQTDGTLWYDGSTFIGDGKTSFADYNYADDAARQIWGGDWRIPTDAEWTALRDATLYDWVWTDDYLGDGSNHAGRIVTRKNVSGTDPCAGKSIFLPAAGYRNNALLSLEGSYGYYWSSSLNSGYSGYAWDVYFYFGGAPLRGNGYRHDGQSLRPVFCERYPLVAADVSSEDIGRVLAADGNIYADVATANANGGGARAVIAYVGSVPNYFDKFLAIAMENVDGSTYSWYDALTAVGTFAGSHGITIGGTPYNTNAVGETYYDQVTQVVNTASATRTTGVVKGWRLPSVTDWRYIFDGLGRQKVGLTLTAKKDSDTYSSNATPIDPLGVVRSMYYGDANDASLLRSAINSACCNTALQSDLYWSSSEGSSPSVLNVNAWDYSFYYGKFYYNEKGSNKYYVRAVFAY